MRLVWVPRPVFLLLFLAIVLVLSFLFQLISKQNIHQFSSNPLFEFLLCNIIIFAIFVGDHRPPTGEVDSILPFPSSSAEGATYDSEDDGSSKHCNIDGLVNSSEDDDEVDGSEEDAYYNSDGYDEDDDDNGSDDEIGWGDTDESDDNLETRVEDFISRVYKGWQKERLRDTMQFFGYIKSFITFTVVE